MGSVYRKSDIVALQEQLVQLTKQADEHWKHLVPLINEKARVAAEETLLLFPTLPTHTQFVYRILWTLGFSAHTTGVENIFFVRQFGHRTVHSTQHTVHITQYTVDSTHYTIYIIQYTIHNTHYTTHNTHYTSHSTQYTVQYTVHSTHYTLHNT